MTAPPGFKTPGAATLTIKLPSIRTPPFNCNERFVYIYLDVVGGGGGGLGTHQCDFIIFRLKSILDQMNILLFALKNASYHKLLH